VRLHSCRVLLVLPASIISLLFFLELLCNCCLVQHEFFGVGGSRCLNCVFWVSILIIITELLINEVFCLLMIERNIQFNLLFFLLFDDNFLIFRRCRQSFTSFLFLHKCMDSSQMPCRLQVISRIQHSVLILVMGVTLPVDIVVTVAGGGPVHCSSA